MNALLQAALSVPSRPDPRHDLISVCIGDEALTAECSVTGRYRPAVTQADPMYCHPEEHPEIEVVRLWTADLKRDVSGLLEFSSLADKVREDVEAEVGERTPETDPDDAYDRWRDRQMEEAS